jgi:hypothetical protein
MVSGCDLYVLFISLRPFLTIPLSLRFNYISAIFSFKINILYCESSLSYFVNNYSKIKWVTAKVSFIQTPIISSLNTPFLHCAKVVIFQSMLFRTDKKC